MAVLGRMHVLAEVEQLPDMVRRAGLEAGIFRHHVVEAQQQMVDLEIVVERLRLRLMSVDDREDMADADRRMLRQFGNAADRYLLAGQGHDAFLQQGMRHVQADRQHAHQEGAAEHLRR
ncbi:MAG TPA: hypothetical protein VJR58_11855 [Vineibacter sp.]|nr:hypothetical protein [Vineibacter sp.]